MLTIAIAKDQIILGLMLIKHLLCKQFKSEIILFKNQLCPLQIERAFEMASEAVQEEQRKQVLGILHSLIVKEGKLDSVIKEINGKKIKDKKAERWEAFNSLLIPLGPDEKLGEFGLSSHNMTQILFLVGSKSTQVGLPSYVGGLLRARNKKVGSGNTFNLFNINSQSSDFNVNVTLGLDCTLSTIGEIGCSAVKWLVSKLPEDFGSTKFSDLCRRYLKPFFGSDKKEQNSTALMSVTEAKGISILNALLKWNRMRMSKKEKNSKKEEKASDFIMAEAGNNIVLLGMATCTGGFQVASHLVTKMLTVCMSGDEEKEVKDKLERAYALLECSEIDIDSKIRSQWRKLCMQFHPDKVHQWNLTRKRKREAGEEAEDEIDVDYANEMYLILHESLLLIEKDRQWKRAMVEVDTKVKAILDKSGRRNSFFELKWFEKKSALEKVDLEKVLPIISNDLEFLEY